MVEYLVPSRPWPLVYVQCNILACAKQPIGAMRIQRSTRKDQKAGVASIPGNPSPLFKIVSLWNYSTHKNEYPHPSGSLCLRWIRFCLSNVFLNNSWILSCAKPRALSWQPILGTHLRLDTGPSCGDSFFLPKSLATSMCHIRTKHWISAIADNFFFFFLTGPQ